MITLLGVTSLDFQKVDPTIYCIEESKSPEVFPTVTVSGPIKVRHDTADSPCPDVWQAARVHGKLPRWRGGPWLVHSKSPWVKSS